MLIATAAIVLSVACGGEAESPDPGANAGTAPSPSPAGAGTATEAPFTTIRFTDPDAMRASGSITHLAGVLGIRPAGTAAERAAARWLADELRAAGYVVTLESFDYETVRERSAITVPGEAAFAVQTLLGGAQTEAVGPIVYAGLGSEADLAALASRGVTVRGAVVLLDRGDLTFGTKVANAERAGAVAVIVRNNAAGSFSGTLGGEAGIPVVSVTTAEGDALHALIASGVAIAVRADRATVTETSQNVVARPPTAATAATAEGDGCRGYIGAHYDSVPAGPGANDNASGTAVMLELARTHQAPGLCMIGFGAEELGLFGSLAFVERHDLGAVTFVLNIDMAAMNGDLQAIGDPTVTGTAVAAAQAAGRSLRVAQFPPNASADHVPFLQRGVPAFTLHAGDDPVIHTAEDDIEHIDPVVLEETLATGAVVLRALVAALLPPPEAAAGAGR